VRKEDVNFPQKSGKWIGSSNAKYCLPDKTGNSGNWLILIRTYAE
jgi:hypothetical protein